MLLISTTFFLFFIELIAVILFKALLMSHRYSKKMIFFHYRHNIFLLKLYMFNK